MSVTKHYTHTHTISLSRHIYGPIFTCLFTMSQVSLSVCSHVTSASTLYFFTSPKIFVLKLESEIGASVFSRFTNAAAFLFRETYHMPPQTSKVAKRIMQLEVRHKINPYPKPVVWYVGTSITHPMKLNTAEKYNR